MSPQHLRLPYLLAGLLVVVGGTALTVYGYLDTGGNPAVFPVLGGPTVGVVALLWMGWRGHLEHRDNRLAEELAAANDREDSIGR